MGIVYLKFYRLLDLSEITGANFSKKCSSFNSKSKPESKLFDDRGRGRVFHAIITRSIFFRLYFCCSFFFFRVLILLLVK